MTTRKPAERGPSVTIERKLRTDVYVGGVKYPAGTQESDVPSGLITNPRAWDDFPEEPDLRQAIAATDGSRPNGDAA